MFDSGSSQFSTAMQQNIPNASMMQMMYSGTFGNMDFTVMPASPGAIQSGFPSMPYLSLEAVIYNQQMSNPMTAPSNILTGNTSGSQNISGQQTVTDNTGTVRMVTGFDPNGF